jgi:chemotaxis protein MotB
MKADLKRYDLQDNVTIFEEAEGIKVFLRDKIFFKEGSVIIQEINIEVLEKLIKLLKDSDWILHVMGYSALNERSDKENLDSYFLSARRAAVTSKVLVERGIQSNRIVPVFYGDTRQDTKLGSMAAQQRRKYNRKVEFLLRKRDLTKKGRKVSSY